MKRNRRTLACLLGASVLFSGWDGAFAELPRAQERVHPALVLSVKANRLNARIQERPLAQVLEELARHIPLDVYYNDDTVGKQTVSDRFDGLPLEEGIRRILKNTSHVLSYAQAEGEKDRRMQIRIATSDTGSVSLSPQETGPAAQGEPPDRAQRLRDLIKQALEGQAPKDRIGALRALRKEFEEHETLPTYIEVLKDKDLGVRTLALGLITSAKERVPMNTVADIGLNADEDRRLRVSALSYVGRRYLGESAPILQKAIDDPVKAVSHRARFLLKIVATGITEEEIQKIQAAEEQEEKELEAKEEELEEKELSEQAEQ